MMLAPRQLEVNVQHLPQWAGGWGYSPAGAAGGGWWTQRLQGGWTGTSSFTDFNFWTPERQSFPASNAELTAAGLDGAPAAAWAMQDAAGGTTLTDFSGNSKTLSKTIAPANLLQGQRAVGLFDGASFTSQLCVEMTGASSERYTTGNVADFNYNFASQSWSVLLVWRGRIPTTTNGLCGHRSTVGGWEIRTLASGIIQAILYDSAGSPIATAQQASSGLGLVDGGWHFVYVRFDHTAQRIYVDTDYLTGTVSGAPSGTHAVGNAGFSVGGSNFLAAAPGQHRGIVIWPHATNQLTAIQTWWKHGAAPAGMTYTRASQLSVPVTSDSTGDVVSTWGSGQTAYGYNSLTSTNALGLGLSVYATGTNLLPYSDLYETTHWVTSGGGGTRTDRTVEGPRGFRDATKHTGTATQRILAATTGAAALTNGTVYTASVWVRWDGTGTAPTLEVYRADGTTLATSVNATAAGSVWRRIQVTFTAAATEGYRLGLMGRDGNAWFCMPMVNTGNYARPYVHTRAAAATSSAIVARVAVPGLTTEVGTLKVWATLLGQDSTGTRYLAAAVNAAGSNAYQRAMGFGSTEFGVAQHLDSAGTVTANASPGAAHTDLATVETIAVGQWDRTEANGWSVRYVRNGTAATNTTDMAAGFATTTVLYAGTNGAAVNHLDGEISKIRVWTRVELSA
jgi:hypothetical protein